MREDIHSKKLMLLKRSFLYSSIALATSYPGMSIAQQNPANNDPQVEEVVVTGTYIRNSAFAGASPVDTIDQETLLSTGSVSTGQFMRDLVYTDNIDAVSNVLGGPGGGQDGNTSGFNLRGLGSSSTLTLFDGRRTVNSDEVGSLVPDIALNRMEIVLDGGSALYGSDAVAGVVNLIPIKQYDGVRVRTSYGRDEAGGFEEYSAGMLFGTQVNDFNIVGALQYKKDTHLMRTERPKYLRADNDIFTDGPPGTFRSLTSATPLVDPSCGTFGNDQNDKGKFDSFPSGIRLNNGQRCAIFFGQWIQYNRPNEQYTGYLNVTHQTTDWLELEYQMVADHNLSVFITEASSPMNSTRAATMVIPANHPANPFGQAVFPIAYRTFNGRSNSPQPSYIQNGSQWDDSVFLTDRHSFTGRYELGNDWSGQTSLSYQTRRFRYSSYEELASRVQAAFQGRGGPGGNQWFNPFMSSDSRSPFFVRGVTENSQEVVDWLSERRTTEDLTRFRVMDSFVTGPIVDLPAGPIQMAFGGHIRDERVIDNPIKLNAQGNNFNTPATKQTPAVSNSLVRAAFLEFEAPLLDSLSIQAAARYEKFEDLNLRTTTPKVAMRWEAHPTLAIRASWGEGFLAPLASQVGAINFNTCSSARDGTDQLTATSFIGVDGCTTTNPNLDVERSTLQNIGFTWEPLDGLSIGLDYQEIKYTGRIFTLTNQDIGTQDFLNVLAAIGTNAANFNRTPGSATWEAARAYVNANPNPAIVRDPVTLRPSRILRQPQNVDQMDVHTFDLQARYRYSAGNLGDFIFNLDATHFHRYMLTEFDGTTRDMAGYNNGDTGKAPPLPRTKFNFGISWMRDAHSARILTKYTDDVIFGNLAPVTLANPPATVAGVRKNVKGGYRTDINYGYTMDGIMGFGQSANISLAVRNVFDWEPTRLPIQGGLETRLYDPYGRVFTLSLDVEI
ncbi:MAG: TonB-dependent receptor [Gammaproteobacteria bacterium]|nr:TonB-dependent receptor [Gammaproteobacteria bacterium]MDP2347644.1 TonB-dependent receptor [Gammaproteobacteria bacterium]